VDIREGRAKRCEEVLEAVKADDTGIAGVVVNESGGKDLVGYSKVPFVPHFLNVTPNRCFVCL
jgi:hypothetical protein